MKLFVDVPQFYTQTDSKFIEQRDRKCFASTCAMAVKFHLPLALTGSNADDDYFQVVQRYGDTTSWRAQKQALKHYGLDSRFTTRGTFDDLKQILAAGRPVVVGWLHHGPPSSPRGGGHYSLLVGIDDTHVTMHDPYGEADMVNGGYVKRGPFGRNIRYTIKNWLPRWTHGGEAWYLDVLPPVRVPATALNAPSKAPVSPPKAPPLPYMGDWASVVSIAAQKGSKWPQVVAAQWALESGYGKITSGRNNFFGIKGTPGTLKLTEEWENGKFVQKNERFKDYNTPEDSIEDLIRLWYKDFKGYKGVNRASSAEDCCYLLQSEGYATDPQYPSKLIKLIEENT